MRLRCPGPTGFEELQRVVKDDAERVALSAAQAAHAMAHVDAVDAAGTSDGPVMDGENDRVALGERYYLDPRLHARPLFGEHKLAAGEVGREQESGLQREDVLTVKILVQTVVVARAVLQK